MPRSQLAPLPVASTAVRPLGSPTSVRARVGPGRVLAPVSTASTPLGADAGGHLAQGGPSGALNVVRAAQQPRAALTLRGEPHCARGLYARSIAPRHHRRRRRSKPEIAAGYNLTHAKARRGNALGLAPGAARGSGERPEPERRRLGPTPPENGVPPWPARGPRPPGRAIGVKRSGAKLRGCAANLPAQNARQSVPTALRNDGRPGLEKCAGSATAMAIRQEPLRMHDASRDARRDGRRDRSARRRGEGGGGGWARRRRAAPRGPAWRTERSTSIRTWAGRLQANPSSSHGAEDAARQDPPGAGPASSARRDGRSTGGRAGKAATGEATGCSRRTRGPRRKLCGYGSEASRML